MMNALVTPGIRVSIGWETAQALGALAVICCLLLCVLPVRPRVFASKALSLRRHQIVGWLALTAAVLHVALLLTVDRRVVEHLRPTAPLYEWAAILALAALLGLTVPAAGPMRRRLWSRHRNFQALHVGLTCLLVLTIAVHVVTTDRYLHGRARVLTYIAFSAAALLALLRARTRPAATHRPLRFINRLAFQRHSARLLAIVVVSIIGVFTLLPRGAVLALREPLVARASRLAIDFPHDNHRLVACVRCHHNFIDRTGDRGCISCHRGGGSEIQVGAEARFHDLCLGCHRNPPAQATRHGPVTGCATCHVPPAVNSEVKVARLRYIVWRLPLVDCPTRIQAL